MRISFYAVMFTTFYADALISFNLDHAITPRKTYYKPKFYVIVRISFNIAVRILFYSRLDHNNLSNLNNTG